MGRVYDEIDDYLRSWIGRQSMFFVATAPLSADGHVNVSPKGPIGSLRVLGPHRIAYLVAERGVKPWRIMAVTFTNNAPRETRERVEVAVSGSRDGSWDWDGETGQVDYAPRWKEMLGYAEDEVADRAGGWERLLHPEDRPSALARQRE